MDRDEEREEREVAKLLAQLDHPAPQVTFGDVARRAAERRPRPRLWRLAAGVALVVGLGGVAYALPGSPLPRWVDRAFTWAASLGRPESSDDHARTSPEPFLPGIAMTAREDLLIRFESTHSNGNVVVSLTREASVAVRAPQGAATFSSGDGVIVVHAARPGATFEVQIPESAPRVEIQVNGRRVLLKEGPLVTPSLAGASAIVLPMGPPRP